MWKQAVAGAIVCAVNAAAAELPAKVDFRRDVQPLFKTYCIGCHGPTQQMNGFRLDRRRDAMRGGTIPVIGPGNSDGSRFYKKLIGSDYGQQMPPTGPLTAEQINILKAWIDQGAEWPDDLSGETPAPPPDPKATRMMDALRNGDREAFKKMLATDRKAANRKGPGGATPLMYAALYGDAEAVRLLLKAGADPNVCNEAGATALMWAVDDLEKTRLLLERGADPNARSEDARTPLIIAAGRFGSSPVLKLLLDRGATPAVEAHARRGGSTALSEAAYAADEGALRMLIQRGADVKSAGSLALGFAFLTNCARCVDSLIQSADNEALNGAIFMVVPPLGDARYLKMLVDHGIDVKTKDLEGRTLLMRAASSEALPMETVKTLIERGVDVNAKGAKGDTALELAQRHGNTPIAELLVKAGARETAAAKAPAPEPKPAASARAAIERSIPLLQRTDVTFIRKSGCVSCHNNTLTAMTVAAARKGGIGVDEEIARKQLKTIATYVDGWRDRALQGVGIPGDSDTVSYILLGMAAEKYPPDAATDALARYLTRRQLSDGRWAIFAHRPPLESSDIEVTAASMRAIQIYGPKAPRAEYEKAVQLAAKWLAKAQPKSTEDRAFQLLGLGWAGADQGLVRKAARELVAEQRADGGWSQLPSLTSDAYATGQALVALKESGVVTPSDAAYKRGIDFLVKTQLEDGSWYVKSRAIPLQPLFESGFPYGHDQWISASGTNWATMALAMAAGS